MNTSLVKTKTFIKALILRNGFRLIFRDFYRFYLGQKNIGINSIVPWTVKIYSEEERTHSLEKAINWLLEAQRNMKDNGFGSYSFTEGWTSSYPETTGYIIPTLLNYAKQHDNDKIIASAILAADWLLSVQRESGGWQGGYLDENSEVVVFNTGQILRGLLPVYRHTNNEKYLRAIIRACNWLCETQDKKGYWSKHTFLQMTRVYDSYVSSVLLEAFSLTSKEEYKNAAIKNIEWIIQTKQRDNGWFEDADNSIKKNNQPILHTIAYTIDGILDAGAQLNNENFITAARKGADALFKIFNTKKYLVGRYNENWEGTVKYIMPTGCAQVSIIWLKLFKLTQNIQYLNAALKMNDILIFLQDRISKESSNTHGALSGSFPLWEEYQDFIYPNWATKYMADALMLEKELLNSIKKNTDTFENRIDNV